MAAVVETNWKRFLSLDSGLPPDVFFVVKEVEREEGSKGSGWKTIEAHKFLLAGTSPVFMDQFFGPMKQTREVFKVKKHHSCGLSDHDQLHLQVSRRYI